MKKIIYLIIAAVTVFSALGDAYAMQISDELLRFHIVANSNSPYDQAVKLELRDYIFSILGDELSKCTNKEDSIEFLQKNRGRIKRLADNYLDSICCDAKTKISLQNGWFPRKDYGEFVLPKGKYDSFKIIIGNGKGKNFFCVMFPPACVSKEMTGRIKNITQKRKIIYKSKLFAKE